MDKDNTNGQAGLEVDRNTEPTFATSRRNFVAGATFMGAFVASTVLGASDASAFWSRWRWRWRRRRRRRQTGGGSDSGNVHCFLEGTRVLTPQGERGIEHLQVGDLIQTASGEAKPIKWIGRATMKQRDNGGWLEDHVPVKVSRGALNGTLPYRDLYVTDSHCFLINGLLIRAIDLVNGATIAKKAPASRDQLDYYHIELADHDVIIANGAPAETLRAEAGERQNFDNFDEYVRLYGPEPATVPACAPLVANKNLIQELQSRSRSVVAPVWDRRRPLEIIRDALADRAYREAA